MLGAEVIRVHDKFPERLVYEPIKAIEIVALLSLAGGFDSGCKLVRFLRPLAIHYKWPLKTLFYAGHSAEKWWIMHGSWYTYEFISSN